MEKNGGRKGRKKEGMKKERKKERRKKLTRQCLSMERACNIKVRRPDLCHGSLFLPMTTEIQFSLALSQGSILRPLAQSCTHNANVVGDGSAEQYPAVEADTQLFLKG